MAKIDVNLMEKVKAVVSDTIADFFYYDRKECEYLPLRCIEEAIKNGDITEEEIIQLFKVSLEEGFKTL